MNAGGLSSQSETPTERPDAISGRVAWLFSTQVATAAIGIINGFQLARLLGPGGKGEYYLVVLLPATLATVSQLGLAQALGFHAARGQTRGIVIKAVVLAAALSIVPLAVVLATLPALRESILRGPDVRLIVAGLLILPLLLAATLTTDIVIGRQAVRAYAAVSLAYSLGAMALLLVLVGVLRLGVSGAVAAFVLTSAVQACGFVIVARRVAARVEHPEPVSYRRLFRFGLPLYPGSLTLFFSYRADVYLLSWLLVSPSVPLGYYSLAVSLAEMVFFVPNAVATLFFPHVAGSPRETADREVPTVARVTLLVTIAGALTVFPAGTLLVVLLLPAFTPSLPALYVLLPGVAMLSVTKVLSGYVSGLGMPGRTSLVNTGAFALNVAANLVLIPRFGIVGAAAASLISYSASSLAFSFVAGRLAGVPAHRFLVPTPADVRLATATAASLVRRFRARSVRRGLVRP